MSCIDAAIIKALVEHIGGNPDDVTVGGGDSYVPVQWREYEMEGYNFAGFTLPDGVELQYGDKITLVLSMGGKSEKMIGYLNEITGEYGKPATEFVFTCMNKVFVFALNSTHQAYICDDLAMSMSIDALPDNKSTGISRSSDPVIPVIFMCINKATQ